VNPLKRLKLKSQLRNCDYVLAGTVIKQQYYDPTKPTVINSLIDEFMANPNFENALKLIEYNEMLTFYFTESCAGGLYVRKSAQDAGTPSAQPTSRSEHASRPAPAGTEPADEPVRFSGGAGPSGAGPSGMQHAQARPGETPEPPDVRPAEGKEAAVSAPERAESSAPADSPASAERPDPADPFENDPKRKLRRQKQQQILEESEALMEQLLSFDWRRRRQAPKPEKEEAPEEERDIRALRGLLSSGAWDLPGGESEAAVRKARGGKTETGAGLTGGGAGFTDAAGAADGWSPAEEAEREAASAREAGDLPARTVRGEDEAETMVWSGRRAASETLPDDPKPAWTRKPRADDAGPDMEADGQAAKIPEILSPEQTSPARAPAADAKPEIAAAEPPVHRLPKRSYANVIATLKIDIHTMATQLEEYRRALSHNPPNEKQLIGWINALEDAIEEFSQVVDHLEEHQAELDSR